MPNITNNYKAGGIESSEVDLNLYPLNTDGIVSPSSGLVNAPSGLTPPLTISTNGTPDNYEQKAVDISGDTATRSFINGFGFSPWLVQGTAAYADVQSSPTDTTAGRLLNNETTEIGGFVNYTGANYQPEISLGFGVARIMSNKTGANVLDGTEISGANLRVSVVLSSGAWTATATTPTGTWKHVSGATIANNEFGYFTRIA